MKKEMAGMQVLTILNFTFIICIILSTTILAQIYPEGMVSYWKLDEGNGSIAYDAVGNSNGTIYGATWTTGIVSDALSFDGINDRVLLGFIASTDHVTLEAWVKLPSDPRYDSPIIAKERGSGYGGSYNLALQPRKQPRFLISVGNWWEFLHSPNLIDVNFWYHLAGTYDGSEMKIYVNGELKNTFPVVGSVYEGGKPVYIGYNGLNQWHKGLIDEVAIYNRALTADEIYQHYQNGLNGLGYEVTISVSIDIKPGSDPNSINPNSNGVIPVAIISSDDFDATTVDPSTVRFGPDEAPIAHNNGHIEDVDGDGDMDLLLHFKTRNTGIQCGDTEAGLTGETYGGQQVAGTDAIETVGCEMMNKDDLTQDPEISSSLPGSYALYQNFPNPFNPTTSISYSLPIKSNVVLKVFNTLGLEVATLINEEKQAGNYETEFNATELPSGVYFYRLQVYAPGRAESFVEIKKMVFLK